MGTVQNAHDQVFFEHLQMRAILMAVRHPNRFIPNEIMEQGNYGAERWIKFALESEVPHGKAVFMRTAAFHYAARVWLRDEPHPPLLIDGLAAALRHRDATICRPALDGLHQALYPNGDEFPFIRHPHDAREAATVQKCCNTLMLRAANSDPECKTKAKAISQACGQ